MINMAYTPRIRLLRTVQILFSKTNQEHPYSIQNIADELQQSLVLAEKPNRRTISNDVVAMIDLGFPIKVRKGPWNMNLIWWDEADVNSPVANV